MSYRRTKRDANHAEIVAALEAEGFSVLDLAAVGGGCPDLLVGTSTDYFALRNVLLEIKRPGVAGKKRGKVQAATNDKQAKFRAMWRGPVYVVDSIEAALKVCRS